MNPKRILIVDDAPVTVMQIRRQLEESGYAVEMATNGVEGLAVIKTRPVDLIITDIVMPVMDGIDFFQALKKDPSSAYLPVIVITDSYVIQESFRSLGVNDFISKPVDGENLISRVEDLLKLSLSRNRYGKILVVCNDAGVLKEIKNTLAIAGFDVKAENAGADSITTALKIIPNIILIDILLNDVTAKEVVKAVRCFFKLKSSKILLYTQFDPEDISDINLMEQLKDSKNACLEEGATKYIGRFSRTTFFDSLKEFI
jgi:CheY-like chemotaxis protein